MRICRKIAGPGVVGHKVPARASRRCSLVWAGLAAALYLSCGYDPHPTSGREQCSSRTQACPEGYVCRSGYCWLANGSGAAAAPQSSTPSCLGQNYECTASNACCEGLSCVLNTYNHKGYCEGDCSGGTATCNPAFDQCAPLSSDLVLGDKRTNSYCQMCSMISCATTSDCGACGACIDFMGDNKYRSCWLTCTHNSDCPSDTPLCKSWSGTVYGGAPVLGLCQAGSSGSGGSGGSSCDYSACLMACSEAGGTNCGDLCKCQ